MPAGPKNPYTPRERVRASTPRAKTGCLTCRVRHVKCGEEKPRCQRCSNSGQACSFSSSQEEGRIGHSISSPHSVRELRQLDYFRQRATLDLSGYDTQSPFWRYIVPQASQSSPAALHAALALGAFHEQMDIDSGATPKDNLFRFHLQQVNKSINYLCQRGTTQPVQVALICCILFICLHNAKGEHEIALRHLESGLSILDEWRRQVKSVTNAEEVISQMICKLDLQATTFLDSRKPSLHTNSFKETPAPGSRTQQSFSSLQDAQVALESLEVRSLYALTSSADPFTKKVLIGGLESRFTEWQKPFDALLSSQSPRMQKSDLQLAVLLQLHRKTMALMLKIKSDTEFQNSRWMDLPGELEFSNIISEARSLINSSITATPIFTAETGIIAPLYFTAMTSHSSRNRKEAIELMSRCKRKEGFWDPEVAVKIATTVSEFMDAGIPELSISGGIPDLAKLYSTVAA